MDRTSSLAHHRLNSGGIQPALSYRPYRALALSLDLPLDVPVVSVVAPMNQTEKRAGDAGAREHAGRASNADAEDASLLEATARQDRRAFETLYRRYAPRLGGYLYKILRRDDLVEEAFNDVMTVVWRSAGRFDGRAKASTWLFGIAHNKALKTLERVRRHRGVDSFEDESTPALERLEDPNPGSNPEHAAGLRDLGSMLGKALATLSAEQRAVMELTFNEGLSYPEIAEIAGVPVNTVKTRMFHARKRLTAAMAALQRPAAEQEEDKTAQTVSNASPTGGTSS